MAHTLRWARQRVDCVSESCCCLPGQCHWQARVTAGTWAGPHWRLAATCNLHRRMCVRTYADHPYCWVTKSEFGVAATVAQESTCFEIMSPAHCRVSLGRRVRQPATQPWPHTSCQSVASHPARRTQPTGWRACQVRSGEQGHSGAARVARPATCTLSPRTAAAACMAQLGILQAAGPAIIE